MRAIAVIITCLLGLSCASTKSIAQVGSTSSATPVGNAANPNVTAIADEHGVQLASGANPPDAQTLRVAKEPVLWKMIKPFEKKYKAECKMFFSDDASNKNPHWTCLNNSACSYAVVLNCAARKDSKTPVLSLEVDGFDDGKENQIQTLSVTYLQK